MKVILLTLPLVLLTSCVGPNPAVGARVKAWHALDADDGASVVPQADVVRFPGAAEWAEIGKRARPALIDDEKDE